MIRALMLSVCLVALSGCAQGPRQPLPAHRAECEGRGWTVGTSGYHRCIRGLEGQEVIDTGRRWPPERFHR
ncbi:MAG: hypothetical protein OEU09_11095 [Rhodospirillales bacterium]|nr:hypothetical protein [Rhodospirillales bacterium]MDH3791516.1 hypothetical protein [Rhodospirillales bacterium]MDH3911835.1 hypothetical protein [Rhodospirillales bacterium]MDH3969200.1 hypothetical protein [Rhodospirillales bacterium]